MNEERKSNYKNIVYRLQIISNKIDTLTNGVNNLKNTINQNININNQPYNNEKIIDIQKNLSNTVKTIRENIIPSINRKI